MNLPNKLTIARILMVPLIVVLILLAKDNGLIYAAGVLFLLASFTDFLDGYLARKNNWITNFGKFMDPLADKLLICSILICLIARGTVPAWAVIVGIRHQRLPARGRGKGRGDRGGQSGKAENESADAVGRLPAVPV